MHRAERRCRWLARGRVEAEQRFESACRAGPHTCVGISQSADEQRLRRIVHRLRTPDRFVDHGAHRGVRFGAQQRSVVVLRAHLRQCTEGGAAHADVRRSEERNQRIAMRRILDASDGAGGEALRARVAAGNRGTQCRHARFARMFGFENGAVHRDLRQHWNENEPHAGKCIKPRDNAPGGTMRTSGCLGPQRLHRVGREVGEHPVHARPGEKPYFRRLIALPHCRQERRIAANRPDVHQQACRMRVAHE